MSLSSMSLLETTPASNYVDDNPLARFLIQDDLAALITTPKRPAAEEITISVNCVCPLPDRPGEMCRIKRSMRCKASEKIEETVRKALENMPEIPQAPNRKYYLGYEQLLFREGTLAECGIGHEKSVELYAPGKNAAAYHNQGLSFVLWSLIPLILGIAALGFAVTSNSAQGDANDFEALFLFLGLLLVIPAAMVFVLGLILIPVCPMPCYFSGTEWW
jgi:hypothetical protein